MLNTVLGLRIRKLRIEKKLSQLELAKYLNISNTTLSQYESGKRMPGDEIKIKIAQYFNVSLDYLFGCTDVRNPYPGKEAGTKDHPDDYHFLDNSGLCKEDVSKVKEYIDLLRQKYNHAGKLRKK